MCEENALQTYYEHDYTQANAFCKIILEDACNTHYFTYSMLVRNRPIWYVLWETRNLYSSYWHGKRATSRLSGKNCFCAIISSSMLWSNFYKVISFRRQHMPDIIVLLFAQFNSIQTWKLSMRRVVSALKLKPPPSYVCIVQNLYNYKTKKFVGKFFWRLRNFWQYKRTLVSCWEK